MNQQGQWQVAGTAAEVYEKELVPAVFAPWAPIVVDLAHPRKGDRVLDVACGTGIVARAAADRVGPNGRVVGVDLNPGMLKVARATWSTGSRSGMSAEWHEASADNLPFPDASFDIAYCQLGLQFFADRAAALGEMRRVLAGGGRLADGVARDRGESRLCCASGRAGATHRSGGGESHACSIWVVQCRRIGRARSQRRLPRGCHSTAGWDSSLSLGRAICVELRCGLAAGRPLITSQRFSARCSHHGCSQCFKEIYEQCRAGLPHSRPLARRKSLGQSSSILSRESRLEMVRGTFGALGRS
jgi:Methyltransferase domain